MLPRHAAVGRGDGLVQVHDARLDDEELRDDVVLADDHRVGVVELDLAPARDVREATHAPRREDRAQAQVLGAVQVVRRVGRRRDPVVVVFGEREEDARPVWNPNRFKIPST